MGSCASDDSKDTSKRKEEEKKKVETNDEIKEKLVVSNGKSGNKLQRRKSINHILIQNKVPQRNDSKKLTFQRKQSIKYLNEFKNNDQMHNKNFLLNRLAKTLTKNTLNREEYEKKKKEETPEYVIDWKLERHKNMITYSWKNMGLIKLTKELIDDVIKMSPEEAKDCDCLYKKRIWLHFYIASHLLQKRDKENPLIIIHRNNILEESYNQFMTTTDLNLLQPLQVHFVDEVAHDEGGVYREWYACLFKEFFNEKNNLFCENPFKSSYNGTFIINLKYDKKKLGYFQFFGKLMVKAIVDNVYMNEHLNLTVIKNLLNKKIELEEMKFYDLSVYNSLKTILETKIESNENLKEMTFTYNLTDGNGKIYEIELVPEGKNMYLTDENKNTFIEKVIYYETFYRYEEQIEKMREGFFSLFDEEIMKLFKPEEFNFQISGQKIIDLEDWKKNTIYKGHYNEDNQTIKYFWEVLSELSQNDLFIFFNFCTSSTHVPLDGFNSLKGVNNKIQKFTIEPKLTLTFDESKNNEFKLIEAKTCFNRILLPEYNSKEEMKKSINIILGNDTQFFGLE